MEKKKTMLAGAMPSPWRIADNQICSFETLRLLNKDATVDVLFVANINPNKRGSFEDFMIGLSERACLEGFKIGFVFGGDVEEKLRNSGIRFITAHLDKIGSPFFLYRVVRKLKPKCIHFHFMNTISITPLLCKRGGVKKVLVTDHNSSIPTPLKKGLVESLKSKRRSAYLKAIDHMICVSSFVASKYKCYPLFYREKVLKIYNGIDLQRFSPICNAREKNLYKNSLFGLVNSEPVITFAGQFITEKGLMPYVKAVKTLIKHYPDVIFAFAGTGPLQDNFNQMFEQSELHRIRILGFSNDLPDVLRASDIFVIPSIWEEAFGLVAAEASACGVAIVGSNIGGIPEVVLDNITGILTLPNDVDGIVNTLKKMLDEPSLRCGMGAEGRRHAEKNFDLHKRVGDLICLYKRCLEEAGHKSQTQLRN